MSWWNVFNTDGSAYRSYKMQWFIKGKRWLQRKVLVSGGKHWSFTGTHYISETWSLLSHCHGKLSIQGVNCLWDPDSHKVVWYHGGQAAFKGKVAFCTSSDGHKNPLVLHLYGRSKNSLGSILQKVPSQARDPPMTTLGFKSSTFLSWALKGKLGVNQQSVGPSLSPLSPAPLHGVISLMTLFSSTPI